MSTDRYGHQTKNIKIASLSLQRPLYIIIMKATPKGNRRGELGWKILQQLRWEEAVDGSVTGNQVPKCPPEQRDVGACPV